LCGTFCTFRIFVPNWIWREKHFSTIIRQSPIQT